MPELIQVQSDDARRRLRALLNEVERGGFVEICRYQDPTAVMVPVEWYHRAAAALGEKNGTDA